MGIVYHFDSDVAKATGNVSDAIVLENIRFWTLKNKSNGRNFHDGRYFTYNTMEAWSQLYGFWTARQIRTILERLEKNGWIVTGVYNKEPFDRTKWYALSDKALSAFGDYDINAIRKQYDAIAEKVNLEPTDVSVENRQMCQTNTIYIPYNKPDNKTIIGADNSCLAKEEKPKGKRRKAGDLSDEQILEITNQISENEEVRAVLADWINDRRSRRLPLTKQGINLNLNKLKGKSDEVIIASLNQSIERGYRGVFVVEPRGNDCGNYTNSIHESTRTVLSATGTTGADYNEAARRKTEQFIREHPELLEPNA